MLWKVDCLGRSLFHVVQVISELGEHGINFRSLSDPIDTASPGGRLVLHIMAALAEFERSLIRERTCAGLAAAKRRGRKLGRRRSLAMDQNERMEDATAVAFEVFELFRVIGDETVFDVSRAIEKIREYGDGRVREAWRRRHRGKVVPLRVVQRALR